MVENPDLDVPFALSAWGALQTCDVVDTSVIEPFVEQWYASPKSAEGGLACQGQARTAAQLLSARNAERLRCASRPRTLSRPSSVV